MLLDICSVFNSKCFHSKVIDVSVFILDLVFSRGNVDKKEALENLDLILLCLDEIVDGGYAIFLFRFSFCTVIV